MNEQQQLQLEDRCNLVKILGEAKTSRLLSNEIYKPEKNVREFSIKFYIDDNEYSQCCDQLIALIEERAKKITDKIEVQMDCKMKELKIKAQERKKEKCQKTKPRRLPIPSVQGVKGKGSKR